MRLILTKLPGLVSFQMISFRSGSALYIRGGGGGGMSIDIPVSLKIIFIRIPFFII